MFSWPDILSTLDVHMHITCGSQVHVASFDDMLRVTGLGEPRPEFTAPPLPLVSCEWKWILRIAGFSISSSGAVTSVPGKLDLLLLLLL